MEENNPLGIIIRVSVSEYILANNGDPLTIEAIVAGYQKYFGDSGCAYQIVGENEYEISFPNIGQNIPIPDVGSIVAEANRCTAQNIASGLLARIIKAIDLKTRMFKDKLANRNITPEQQERYQRKYEAVKNGEWSLLEAEAAITGMTVEDLAALITTTAEAWDTATKKVMTGLEALRIGLNKEVALGNYRLVNNCLKDLEQLNEIPDVTPIQYIEQFREVI